MQHMVDFLAVYGIVKDNGPEVFGRFSARKTGDKQTMEKEGTMMSQANIFCRVPIGEIFPEDETLTIRFQVAFPVIPSVTNSGSQIIAGLERRDNLHMFCLIFSQVSFPLRESGRMKLLRG